MAGLTSRNKGKRGEREVVKLLQPMINEVYGYYELEPPKLERNQMQSNNGGYDIVGLDWLALEVKFQEQLNIKAFWKQTVAQAVKGQEPVLIYRKSRMKWRVMMYAYLRVDKKKRLRKAVDIPVEDFLEYLQHRIASELTNND